MSVSNLHMAWARLFVGALASSGVTRVVVSPGSRSTPLVLAIAGEERMTTHVVVDERSAAFFALGQARVTGEPVLLVCTSGTAGAHYFPAVIEASASHLPLVVVTADRPWEAYDAAAPQTIDQAKLFGAHVRHYAELGLPDASPAALRGVARIAAQAAERARGPIPGAVHINARFRKPLEPVVIAEREPWENTLDTLVARGAPRVHAVAASIDETAAREIADACTGTRKGLIVCGPADAHGDLDARRSAVAALARATGFPVLAEATSQVRFGGADRGALLIAGFDAVFRNPSWRARLAADVILEIGAPPTSTAYATYLAEHAPARRAIIAAHGWNDPNGGATDLLCGDPTQACLVIAAHATPGASDLAGPMGQAEAAVGATVQDEIETGAFTEGRIARDVVDALPEGAALMLANSNPVRDVDTYAPATRRGVRVPHQRGASGIDGLLSGAAGARAVLKGPVALLAGDLAFLHDVGGLAAVRAAGGPLAIVVVQNGGGRIFEQLPIAQSTDARTLERFFVTPQALDVGRVAGAFGIAHRLARTPAELAGGLRDALAAGDPVVVEACVEPNAAARRARIWTEWSRRLA